MSIKRTLVAIAVLIAIALASIPLIGWQARWIRDANESPEEMWEPFVKRRATLRIFYFNPMDCGACEERSLDDLNATERLDFQAVCRDRYGLASAPECVGRRD